MLLPTLLLIKSINAVIILCLYKKRNDISCIIEQYQDTQPFKNKLQNANLVTNFSAQCKKNWLGQTSWPRYEIKILIFVFFFKTFENILLVLHFITNCQSTIHSLTKLILILYSLLLLL